MPQHHRDLGADEIEDDRLTLLLGCGEELLLERLSLRTAAGRDADQAAQDGGQGSRLGASAERAGVKGSRRQQRLAQLAGDVEQLEALLGGHPGEAEAPAD